jgi:hypothetical protein
VSAWASASEWGERRAGERRREKTIMVRNEGTLGRRGVVGAYLSQRFRSRPKARSWAFSFGLFPLHGRRYALHSSASCFLVMTELAGGLVAGTGKEEEEEKRRRGKAHISVAQASIALPGSKSARSVASSSASAISQSPLPSPPSPPTPTPMSMSMSMGIASSPSVATAVAVAVVESTRSFKRRRRRRRWQLEGPEFELPSLLPSILPLSLLFTPDSTTDSSTEMTSREASRQMSQGGMSSPRSESGRPSGLCGLLNANATASRGRPGSGPWHC